MRMEVGPGGAVREVEREEDGGYYEVPPSLAPALEAVLGQPLAIDLRLEIEARVAGLAGPARYFARSQRKEEIRAQLEAVIAHGQGLIVALDAMGDDARARFLERLPEEDELVPERAVHALRTLILPAAREALAKVPAEKEAVERGAAGHPVLDALVEMASTIYRPLPGKPPVSNQGPFVELVRALNAALPTYLRFRDDDKLGARVKTILERRRRKSEAR